MIDNEKLFIDLAEKILINRYGEDNIIKQRPYSIQMCQDSIWSMRGNLEKEADGGVFYLEMNCKDARIIKMEHSR